MSKSYAVVTPIFFGKHLADGLSPETKNIIVYVLLFLMGGLVWYGIRLIIELYKRPKPLPPFDPLGVKMPEWDVKTGPAAGEDLAQKRSQLSRAKCKECSFVYEGHGADRVGEKHAEINGHQVTFEA